MSTFLKTPCGMDIDEMLNRANMARKSIVSPRGSRILFFTEELRKKALAGIEMEAEMRSALGKGGICPLSSAADKAHGCERSEGASSGSPGQMDEERKNLCHAG